MKYILTVCFVGGEMRHSRPADRKACEDAEELLQNMDTVAWTAIAPAKD